MARHQIEAYATSPPPSSLDVDIHRNTCTLHLLQTGQTSPPGVQRAALQSVRLLRSCSSGDSRLAPAVDARESNTAIHSHQQQAQSSFWLLLTEKGSSATHQSLGQYFNSNLAAERGSSTRLVIGPPPSAEIFSSKKPKIRKSAWSPATYDDVGPGGHGRGGD